MLSTELQPRYSSEKSTIKGSESFRLEYDKNIPEKAIWNDIVSYLGEYRFQVQKYQYTLFYTQSEDGLHIRGEEKGKSLLEIGRKGIEDRQQRGEITKKVVADFLGMQLMEVLLQNANDGDTIMYASPADSEEGYTYGFFYIGKVISQNDQEKRLDMTAIRIDNAQDLEKYNTAIKLLTGEDPQFTTVNEFIAHPQMTHKTLSSLEIDFVMKGVFDFAMDQQKQSKFASIIQTLRPYLQEFIDMVKSGISSDVLEPAFYALENYALELQKTYEAKSEVSSRRMFNDAYQTPPANLAMLAKTHGYEPPQVTGSCGSSSKKNKFGSIDILGQGSLWEGNILKQFDLENSSVEEEDEYGSLYFDCPHCGHKNKRPKGELIEYCQNKSCGKSVRC